MDAAPVEVLSGAQLPHLCLSLPVALASGPQPVPHLHPSVCGSHTFLTLRLPQMSLLAILFCCALDSLDLCGHLPDALVPEGPRGHLTQHGCYGGG